MNAALDISISFYCRSDRKKKKSGESPIVLRVIYRGQKRELFTGLYCPTEYWNADFDKVVPKYRPGVTINERLDKMRHKVESEFERLKYQDDEFTIDQLMDVIRGRQAPPQTIQEYIDIKLKEISEEVGVNISTTTFYKYKRTVRYLQEYIYKNQRKHNIAVSTINEDFIESFFTFLRKEKKQGHNSASALMSCLNRILQPAIKKGLLKRNPMTDKVLSRKPVDRGYLEDNEIDMLEALDDLSPSLDLKRDLFLFSVYTGLAYADLRSLQSNQIRQDSGGLYYLEKPRQKSHVMSIVPLLPPAVRILEKYSPTGNLKDFAWRVPSNQKMNKGLKELAARAGINQVLFMHLARHTFATTVTVSNDVSIESVSKMLGHTSLKHTLIYAKIVAQKVKNEMKDLALKYR